MKDIVRKLFPLDTSDIQQQNQQQQNQQQQNQQQNQQPRPQNIRPPDYDPLRIGQPQRPLRFIPPQIGTSDLYPDFVTGGPFSGSQMGPSHPIFQGRLRPPNRPSFVPPNARFDPYGPTPDFDPDHLRRPGFDENPYFM